MAIAHVRQNSNETYELHSLEEHLREVAKLANRFAEPFDSGDWAYLAGLWHDLGKYRPRFQHYIRQVNYAFGWTGMTRIGPTEKT